MLTSTGAFCLPTTFGKLAAVVVACLCSLPCDALAKDVSALCELFELILAALETSSSPLTSDREPRRRLFELLGGIGKRNGDCGDDGELGGLMLGGREPDARASLPSRSREVCEDRKPGCGMAERRGGVGGVRGVVHCVSSSSSIWGGETVMIGRLPLLEGAYV